MTTLQIYIRKCRNRLGFGHQHFDEDDLIEPCPMKTSRAAVIVSLTAVISFILGAILCFWCSGSALFFGAVGGILFTREKPVIYLKITWLLAMIVYAICVGA